MEHGCVPPSRQNQIAAPADCTRPLFGSGRNRYVAATPFHSTATVYADANYPSLPDAANKSCADGWLLKFWLGTVATSVMGQRRFFVVAVPVFRASHILVCWQEKHCRGGRDHCTPPRSVFSKGNEPNCHNPQPFSGPPTNLLYEPPRHMGNATGFSGAASALNSSNE